MVGFVGLSEHLVLWRQAPTREERRGSDNLHATVKAIGRDTRARLRVIALRKFCEKFLDPQLVLRGSIRQESLMRSKNSSVR